MKEIPSGTELARPFLPAHDLVQSRMFYEALGFKKLLDSDVVIFAVGSGSFILAPIAEEHGAKNLMMQLMVDDLDAWWAHIDALDLAARFGVRPPSAPEMQPWGLRVVYLVDPSGVLWHVAQRRAGKVQD